MMNDHESARAFEAIQDLTRYVDRYFEDYFRELRRPSTMFKAYEHVKDVSEVEGFRVNGINFIVKVGDIYGHGKTPDEAMRDFDKNWLGEQAK